MSWIRTDKTRVTLDFKQPVAAFAVRDERGDRLPHRTLLEKRDANNSFTSAEIEFVARDVPSLGYRTFFVAPIAAKDAAKDAVNDASNDTIENEFYRVTVDPQRGGAIKSIYDKAANREVIETSDGHLANEIAALAEDLSKKNVIYPAWEFWTTGARKFSTERIAKVTVEKRGATSRIAVEGEMPNMRGYRQMIELRDGVRRIDLRTELIEYAGNNELFVVNFPLAMRDAAFITEDRFGTVTRNRSKGFLDFRSNTDRLVSGAPVYSAYNWVAAGSSVTLDFTDAAGAKKASVPLRPLAIVRPRTGAHEQTTERIVSALIRRGISATPFYDDDDRARRANLTIEDSTMPRTLNDDISYHSFRVALGSSDENAYTRKLLARIDPAARSAFEARLTRDGAAYLFLYDRDVPAGWQPVPTLVIAGRDDANTKAAIEKLFATFGANADSLQLPVEVFADRERLADAATTDYGVALVNNGTIAASLERPDTLTLFLTHTAPFPGVNLPFGFVPEHKTHVFDYALYPHALGWRAARTTSVGYDFNNPLIARQLEPHAGSLPPTHSFLSIDNPHVILSALKLSGNPQATFRASEGEGARNLVARFYESSGHDAEARVTFGEPLALVRGTDLLERPGEGNETIEAGGKSFRVKADGFGIETYSLTPAKQSTPNPTALALGRTTEAVQPVASRYWLHNAGAAPLGNDPVKISVRPVEQMGALSTFAYDDAYNQGGTTTVAVRVSVVNNYQDRRAQGVATLEAAPGWRVVPERISYDIEPGGFASTDVVVLTYPVKKGEAWERASGLVKARTEHGGQLYQDVLHIGRPLMLTWDVIETDAGMNVRVRNPHRQRIEGALALITPPEAWADELNPREGAAPLEQGFVVAPSGETVISFPISNNGKARWAIARIAYNGFVEYKRADGIEEKPTAR